ncbi:MAG: hypothetical protein DRI70_07910 [Bacteroidetes bacterium]|nr:MAG: hypothetical protein DRI70_07910 [Bacteroidota bacterium]
MTTNNKPNIWYWIITVVALIWNAMGVMRYLMQAYDTEGFRAKFNADQLALLDSTPAWGTGVFAVAVFGGLLGCLFLLLRKKFAVILLGLSLLAVLVQMIYGWFATDMIEVFGKVDGIVIPLIVIVVAIFLYFYSKGAALKGWLK